MISILLATHNRDDLLRYGLASIAQQERDDLEIWVLDEGEEGGETRELAEAHGARYAWTGRTKPSPVNST